MDIIDCKVLVVKDLRFGVSSIANRVGFDESVSQGKMDRVKALAAKYDRVILIGRIVSKSNLKALYGLVDYLSGFETPPLYIDSYDDEGGTENHAVKILSATGLIEVLSVGQSCSIGDLPIVNALTWEAEQAKGLVFTLNKELANNPESNYVRPSALNGVFKTSDSSEGGCYSYFFENAELGASFIQLSSKDVVFAKKSEKGLDFEWLLKPGSDEKIDGVIVDDKVKGLIESVGATDDCKSILLDLNAKASESLEL